MPGAFERNAALVPGAVLITAGIFLSGTPIGTQLIFAGSAMLLGVALTPRPEAVGRALEGRTVTGVDALAPRRVVYGDTRVGGVLTYFSLSGAANEYLNLIITLAGHEVQAIGDLFIEDERVPLDGSGDATGRFLGYVHVEKKLGTAAQTAITALVTGTAAAWGALLGPAGYRAVFDGAGSHATTASNTDLNPATAITIELYLCVHGSGAQTILAFGTHWRLWIGADQKLRFTDGAGTSITATTAISLHQFYRVAVAGNASGITMYAVPQEEETTASVATTATAYDGDDGSGASVLYVATRDGERPWAQIEVGYLAIWDALRTSVNIDADQATALTGAEANLIGLWLFDEGTGATAADSDANANDLTLHAVWSTDHRQRGCAYAWVRLKWNETLFPNGLPNLTFEMQGKKLYDPRTAATVWSDNAALAALDYLQDTVYGMNVATADLDTTLINAAANACDEMVVVVETSTTFTADDATEEVTLTDALNWRTGDLAWVSNSGGGLPAGLSGSTDYYLIRLDESTYSLATTLANARAGTAINITSAGTGTHTITRKKEPRYTVAGMFSVDKDPGNILQELLTAMGGGYSTVTGGKGLFAGVWRTPAITLDESDLRGPIKATLRPSKRDNFNAVKGTFPDPDNGWKPSAFPNITSSAYETEDNGERVWLDTSFPFTPSPSMAQRLAKVALERVRRPITVPWPGRLACMRVQPGDTVYVTNTLLGWSSKTFEVQETQFVTYPDRNGKPAFGYDLVLRELDSTAFSWTAASEETALVRPPATNLPNPLVAYPPTALVLTSGADQVGQRPDGATVSRIHAAWTAPTDQYVLAGGKIESQYKRSWETTYRDGPSVPGDTTTLDILDVEHAIAYDVRVRSLNSLGARSDWVLGSVNAQNRDRFYTAKYAELMLSNLVARYTPAVAVAFNSVAYGNGMFVAGGAGDGTRPTIGYSRDFVNWTQATTGVPSHNVAINKVIFVPELGKFFAIGAADGTDALLLSSTDGITWAEEANPKNFGLNDIAYGGGALVAGGAADGTDSYIITSSGNGTWAERSNSGNTAVNNIIYLADQARFVAAGVTTTGKAKFLTSDDLGATWTLRTTGITLDVDAGSLAYDGSGILCAVSLKSGGGAANHIFRSTDYGTSWTEEWSHSDGLKSVVYADTLALFVAVGEAGRIGTSVGDGTWTTRTPPAATQQNRVEWGNEILVSVGNSGTLWSSVDGTNWIARTTPAATNINDVLFAAGNFAAVGASTGTRPYAIS